MIAALKPPHTQFDRDPAASMSLLDNLINAPLDPEYAAAARRRRAMRQSDSHGFRSPLLVTTMLVIGMVLTVAAHALRLPSGVVDQERNRLISSIKQRQSEIDIDVRTINHTQGKINTLQSQALGRDNQGAFAGRLGQLGAVTGGSAVRGPGWVLTIDDAEGTDATSGSDPRTGISSMGRLTSTDLQIVINGLWKVGAEAIAINGQRLTAQSAIRFAGQAIFVNFRALTSPYQISIIGGPRLSGDFTDNFGGVYLQQLVIKFHLCKNIKTVAALSLPAAPGTTLVYARVSKGDA